MPPFRRENRAQHQTFHGAGTSRWRRQTTNSGRSPLECGAYSIAKMKEYGILISGDAETKGIGCMTDARWKAYYDEGVKVGLYEAGIDYTQAFTTELVCQGLGVDLVK